jgi:hypothetical protein
LGKRGPFVAADQKLGAVELYDLGADPRETTDVARDHQDVFARLQRVMQDQHTASRLFPMRALDER